MIGRALASHFTPRSGFWLETGRQTFGVHIRSQLFAMSEASNADTTERAAISTRRILPWIVRPHDLKAWNAHITCVLEDPHYGLEPSLCSQYSYTGIVPVRPLTGSS